MGNIKTFILFIIFIYLTGNISSYCSSQNNPDSLNKTSISSDTSGISDDTNQSVSVIPIINYKSNLLPVKSDSEFNLLILLRGLLGMFVLIGIAYIFSDNRKAISWRIVGIGLGIQVILAFGVLHVSMIQSVFEFAGRCFVKIIDFTNEGTAFLFKSYSSGIIESPLQNFAISILPTIIFFSALTSVLFYFGIIQKIVWLMGWLLTRLLKLSGAEGLAVAANIFLGQIESPLLIKAYLEKDD